MMRWPSKEVDEVDESMVVEVEGVDIGSRGLGLWGFSSFFFW